MDYNERINKMIDREERIRRNLELRLKQIGLLQDKFSNNTYSNDDVRLLGDIEREQTREIDSITPDI